MIELNIASRYLARPFLRDPELGHVTAVHAYCDLLEVQEDIDDIFLHTLDARVLVQHAFDLRFGDRGARHRRQQNTTQCIAESVAETTFKRFDDDLRLKIGDRQVMPTRCLRAALRRHSCLMVSAICLVCRCTTSAATWKMKAARRLTRRAVIPICG